MLLFFCSFFSPLFWECAVFFFIHFVDLHLHLRSFGSYYIFRYIKCSVFFLSKDFVFDFKKVFIWFLDVSIIIIHCGKRIYIGKCRMINCTHIPIPKNERNDQKWKKNCKLCIQSTKKWNTHNRQTHEISEKDWNRDR